MMNGIVIIYRPESIR